MEGLACAFLATMLMVGMALRFKALRRIGEKFQAEWQKQWEALGDNERREKAKTEFEQFKGVSAAGLNAANIFGILAISFFMFGSNIIEKERGVDLLRVVFAAGIMFFGIIPWLAIYLNDTARRARHYGVFQMGRRGRFLNIGFAAVALASFLLAFPEFQQQILIVPYFVLAIVSAYVLNAWVFFGRPPQEVT